MKRDDRNDLLKIIAILTMLIDHMGILLFPDYDFMRTIGRISFPIFCYFIANGYTYTSNRRNYFFRILGFAFISQIPYMWLSYGATLNPFHFNVLFLFAYSIVVLHFIDKFKDNRIVATLITISLTVIPLALELMIKDFAFSYNYYGIILVVIFYIFNGENKKILFSFLLLSALQPYVALIIYRSKQIGLEATIQDFSGTMSVFHQYSRLGALSGFYYQARSILGILTIFIFSKVRFNYRINKYVFYVFYPAHIILLLSIRYYLGLS